ncbi:MAG: putative hydrolase [Caulobacter sp.]|nr:putative hydrolase [Caulobacter sp.]
MDHKTFETAKNFVDTPSGRIAYAEQGEGPVAVFIHGVLVNSYIWRRQLSELSDVRRCIAVDLLGHGATKTSATQDVSSQGQAVMLAQVLDALGIGEVDLVGNDGGGAVAQMFAVAHPERVRSLTLTNCDAHDNWPPEAFKGFVEMCAQGGLPATLQAMADDKSVYRSAGALGLCYEQPERVSDDTIEAYLRPHLESPERLNDLVRFVAAFDNGQTLAIESGLRALQAPTLVVWGDDDIYFDPKWGRWLKDIIQGARRLIELKGARLFFPEERWEDFNRDLRAHWAAV